MKKQDVFQIYQDCILNTYTRQPRIFVKGKGMTLVDIDGKKYLDFFPGWGVSNVGHCHPRVMSAIRDQVSKLIHIPNNFYHTQQAKLARELIYQAFPGKVFFCNSGTEANEAAIKFARAYGKGERFEIITFENSFHGRTLGSLAATGQKKYQEGFAPLPEGFKVIKFNSWPALEKTISDKTIAIMLELVQGEGGINVADRAYVYKIREICDKKNILMIIDEVQTGIGRTGKMFAFQHYGIEPDIITLAKALGGGLPIGAMIVKKKIADTFKPGMHASTFGGGLVICKAALGVLRAIQKEHMLKNAQKMSAYIFERLDALKARCKIIKTVRGIGLMIGIELNIEGKAITEECLNRGLVINCTHNTVLRLMPALNVTRKQADKALHILEKVLLKFS
ncbi:MAG: aspartate aminotransferase family protein [Candidatus Omnitrophica bacterium]|nr:aspartate aminotransferase family protein [Candidatus Omnitrophota bacterium]MDD5352690.1 aspartate aminotransferase family protein [Candidatus Omnitrophota bacterium]MDD5550289.1 aspartate aminotransferase family protein [Candidatus Omnitrophota bacterium]